MSVTARSTPNIALIKYWGNRDDELRLPAADSLSMTLNGPHVDITVDHASTLHVISRNKEMTQKDLTRFTKHIDLMKRYLGEIGRSDVFPESLAISIDSHIPPAIGLASSAAVFSALAIAVSGLLKCDLSDEEVSVLARLGSGSATRSIYGGFVTMKNVGDGISGAVGEQIADEHHWRLSDIIIVPSSEEKKVGSTEGHAHAWTSPHFIDRIATISNRRQKECIDAILTRDFEKLQSVAEEDALDMHHCMETQNPPLQYLSSETHRLVTEIKVLREREHLPILFTMDAGPTVHIICTDEATEAVRSFAHAQKECKVFEAEVGNGAHLL